MIKTAYLEYEDRGKTFEAYYAYDDTKTANHPLVLVGHDWSGRNAFAEKKARDLAELGYLGFAWDLYGKGITGNTKEEKSALIQPFFADRTLVAHRTQVALSLASGLPQVDTHKIGAIGFCFGGLCVLDLARTGVEIKGVVSFHGLLNAPSAKPQHLIRASVLALHGFDDPMATPDQLVAFGHEMTEAKADWQAHVYGNTQHAFTNPEAHDVEAGLVFKEKANARSWIAMKNFFDEVFA